MTACKKPANRECNHHCKNKHTCGHDCCEFHKRNLFQVLKIERSLSNNILIMYDIYIMYAVYNSNNFLS